MSVRLHLAVPVLILCNVLPLWPRQSAAQSQAPTLSQLCMPKVIASETVASAQQRYEAGQKAEPHSPIKTTVLPGLTRPSA